VEEVLPALQQASAPQGNEVTMAMSSDVVRPRDQRPTPPAPRQGSGGRARARGARRPGQAGRSTTTCSARCGGVVAGPEELQDATIGSSSSCCSSAPSSRSWTSACSSCWCASRAPVRPLTARRDALDRGTPLVRHPDDVGAREQGPLADPAEDRGRPARARGAPHPPGPRARRRRSSRSRTARRSRSSARSTRVRAGRDAHEPGHAARRSTASRA
jgi:hypothetical protein